MAPSPLLVRTLVLENPCGHTVGELGFYVVYLRPTQRPVLSLRVGVRIAGSYQHHQLGERFAGFPREKEPFPEMPPTLGRDYPHPRDPLSEDTLPFHPQGEPLQHLSLLLPGPLLINTKALACSFFKLSKYKTGH